MFKRLAPSVLVFGFAGAAMVAPAHADIYTWVDAKGVTNVSNIAPPDGVTVKNVDVSPPTDPAREAAAREAAQQAEMQAMNARLAQLQADLEQARQPYPPMPYAPPTPTVVVVQPPPQYASYAPPPAYDMAPAYSGGCDFSFDCGSWWGPGFWGTTVVVNTPRGKFHRRFNSGVSLPRPVVPPLVPPPQPVPRMNVSFRHR
jgi:hypothetical protein